MDPKLSWPSTAISNCAQNYHNLVSLLCRDPNYFVIISNTADSSDRDTIARLIVRLATLTNRCLPILNIFIFQEFESGKTNPSTILRANSTASKMQTAYARHVSGSYLFEVIGDMLAEVIQNPSLSLEINPAKLSGSNKTQMLHENQQKLLQTAQRFFDRIISSQSIQKMPAEIKGIARLIAKYADEISPAMKNILVGGFIMLRFFNPALLTPESFELIPPDETIPDTSRRNLTLITKLLQNLSNSMEFGSKEEYMIPMNTFIVSNKEKMTEFLEKVGSHISDEELSVLIQPSREIGSFSVHEVGLVELAKVHRLAYTYQNKITDSRPSIEPFGEVEEIDLDIFMKLMKEMGPPPVVTKSRLVRMPSSSYSSSIGKESSLSSADSKIPGAALSPRTQASVFNDMQESNFFYQGPTNKAGHPVFYLIASRTQPSFMSNPDRVASFITKVMGNALNGPYALAVDMSWSSMTNEMQRNIFENISDFWSKFEHQQRKNMSALYIIHPSPFTSSVIFLMRAFVSRKFNRKIFEIYNWKTLSQHIDPSKTMLPEESRDYITKAHHVTKVNAKGKHQERLIKFTQNSILNIDPSSKTIQNEKRLTSIKNVQISHSEPEIILYFDQQDGGAFGAKSSLFSFKKNDQDSKVRKYLCKTSEERDEILMDLFERAFYLPLIKLPQETTVIKINKAGKRQERLLKLTCDSILNLHENSIHSEISFAGIEECKIEPESTNSFSLKFKHEETKRQFICPIAKEICESIQEGLKKYTQAAMEIEQQNRMHIQDIQVRNARDL